MLNLSLKVGDRVWINDDVCITLCDKKRGETTLGFDAAPGTTILRGKLIPRMEQEVRLARIRGGSDAKS